MAVGSQIRRRRLDERKEENKTEDHPRYEASSVPTFELLSS
ncbi:hypothetical protein COLO4_25098 [Corchorus olitorius]|uniref:Uncharacterized protein n=1 Tax=Corchorus olitorius TaxID=93759 RepID=A0A1R3I4N3_9ROSI|nr:hypothetical protein COLO4_25098 [Corchorus olitorius]